jgi:hypothetical protein
MAEGFTPSFYTWLTLLTPMRFIVANEVYWHNEDNEALELNEAHLSKLQNKGLTKTLMAE